ncbi:MAG: hypothetical protein GXO43_06095 [Crenarchaeota archaeon]|nr:hypothetical protein [Thermoproteota archaeon]
MDKAEKNRTRHPKLTETIIHSIILSILSYIFSYFTAIIRFEDYPQLTSIMNHIISPIFLLLTYIFAGTTIIFSLILLVKKIRLRYSKTHSIKHDDEK